MAEVTVTVETYPYDGVVGFEVEQSTSWGWVSALATAVVGTFPDYIAAYEVTVNSVHNRLRARWETAAGLFTDWFSPASISPTPNDLQVERMTQAIIFKATRLYVLNEAPLGSWGEISEFGVATVRPDYQIQELLYGLRFRNWDIDLEDLALTDDVIRIGLQTDPTTFPADRVAGVQRSIDSAVSWVADYLLNGIGIA